jgi:hypothetical protein
MYPPASESKPDKCVAGIRRVENSGEPSDFEAQLLQDLH